MGVVISCNSSLGSVVGGEVVVVAMAAVVPVRDAEEAAVVPVRDAEVAGVVEGTVTRTTQTTIPPAPNHAPAPSQPRTRACSVLLLPLQQPSQKALQTLVLLRSRPGIRDARRLPTAPLSNAQLLPLPRHLLSRQQPRNMQTLCATSTRADQGIPALLAMAQDSRRDRNRRSPARNPRRLQSANQSPLLVSMRRR